MTYPAWADYPAMLAELEREAAARARTYPDMIAKGRLSEGEATHRRAILDLVRAQVARAAAGDWTMDPAAPFAWAQIVAELDRELDMRARYYPDWIAKGRMQQAAGDGQRAALAQVRDLYWGAMLAWTPPDGTIVCWDPSQPAYATPAAERGRLAVRAHIARVEAETAPAPDLFEQEDHA